MKRFLIAATAMLAIVSCAKEPQGSDPTPTGKKKEVVITCGQSGTKVSGTDDGTGAITFKWEKGDYLYVTEGSLAPVYFTLREGDKNVKGKFHGEVTEAAGESTVFKIQWPDTDPDLTSQTYVEGGIQGAKMLADTTVTGLSKLEAGVELKPRYAVVRLDLKGDAKISSVVLKTSETTPSTYTLSCPSPYVQLGESSATSFYIVAKPTAAADQQLTVTLYDQSSVSLGSFKTSKTTLQLKAGVTLKLGELTLYKDGTFKSTDFNGANWYTHGDDDVNAGDFGGENW